MGTNLINTPSKAFVFVFGGSALFALMIVFATRADPKHEEPTTQRFDAVWTEILPLKKMDRLPIAYEEPRIIQVERVVIPSDVPRSVPPIVMAVSPPSAKHKRHAESNVCTRHKMRKVQHGKSWRCKR